MKNIYISLLLAANIFSLQCAQQQRYKQQNTTFAYAHSNVISIYTNAHSSIRYPIPIHVEANQPGWQKLNNIMNMAYNNNNNKNSENEVELTPIYHPFNNRDTKKALVPQEEKPLLRTLNPVIADKTLIDTIYREGLKVIRNQQFQPIINFITRVQNAKKNHINEDIMGKYAYELWRTDKECSDKEQLVLFFAYLKKYYQKVSTTNEGLPSYNDVYTITNQTQYNDLLAFSLGLSSPHNKKIAIRTYNKDAVMKNYPEFYFLMYYLQNTKSYRKNNLISYLYSKKTSHTIDPLLTYDQLKNQYYNTATYCQTHQSQDRKQYLHALIGIIEAAKALPSPKQEIDFGYDILESEQTMTGKALSLVSIDFSSKMRNSIGVICSIIQKYNTERATKKTPTEEQVQAYKEHCSLPIWFALPDSCDNKLLDAETYAFEELERLTHRVYLLQSATDEAIQNYLNQLYPPRK